MMNITRVTYINFKGRIIDSHTHIGTLGGQTYTKQQLDRFVKSPLPNSDSVTKMIVSDLDVLHGTIDEFNGNKKALDVFKNNPNYILLASCNPKEGNINNIKKLLENYPNNFTGLKFHSAIQQLDLSDKKYTPYMKFASKNNLPCLFHSQVNIHPDGKININSKHIADPEYIYALAKKYPKTPVVIAHLGAGWKESHDKAIDILVESIKKGDANLYADISWVDIDDAQTHIVKAIKRLKGIGDKNWKYGDQSFRLMFGTDAPIARFQEKDAVKIYSDFVEKIKNSIRNDADLKSNAEQIIEDLFFNNAKKLYLSDKPNNKKSISVKSKILIGVIIASLLTYTGYTLHKKHPKKHPEGNNL